MITAWTRGAVTGDLVQRILTATTPLSGVRLVTVDGPAGSGKTTLAVASAQELRTRGVTVEIVCLDDLYEGWDGLDDRLTQHLAEWVVAPLKEGRRIRHRVYDWYAGDYGGWREVSPADVVIVEGVGAGQPVLADVAALRVWVEAPPHVCLERGLARGGVDVAEHWDAWTRREAEHFARFSARERADVILSGV